MLAAGAVFPLPVSWAEAPPKAPTFVAVDGAAAQIQWNHDDLKILGENRFVDSLRENGWSVRTGSWMSMVEDSTVPYYGPNVAQRLFPDGESSGSGTAALGYSLSSTPTVLHVGVLMKISENYVNDAAGLSKIFYLWSNNQSKFILSVHDKQNFELRVLLRYAPGNTGYRGPNLVPSSQARLTPGQWHKVEFRVTSASAPEMGAEADGRVEVWLDDLKTHDRGGYDTHFDGQSLHWSRADWNTIRGGAGPDNPEDMWWWAGALMVAVEEVD